MITMTQTLFGGMLAVILIFFVGRRFGLSAYWSALLAGLLPFLGYLGLGAEGHGGDVLAIHFVVFLATAAVMGVFSATSKKRKRCTGRPSSLSHSSCF